MLAQQHWCGVFRSNTDKGQRGHTPVYFSASTRLPDHLHLHNLRLAHCWESLAPNSGRGPSLERCDHLVCVRSYQRAEASWKMADRARASCCVNASEDVDVERARRISGGKCSLRPVMLEEDPILLFTHATSSTCSSSCNRWFVNLSYIANLILERFPVP